MFASIGLLYLILTNLVKIKDVTERLILSINSISKSNQPYQRI